MNLKNLFDWRKNRMSNSNIYPGIAGAASATSVDWNVQMAKEMARIQRDYAKVPPTKNPDKLIHGMSVDKIENGLLIHINLGGVSKSIYVESLDKLGDAIVSAVVANRIEGEKK